MAKNLKLRIKVEFVETESDRSADRHPEQQADGSFRFEPVSAPVAGGTAVTTLQDNAQKEGARVLDFLERHSQRVLTAHGFEGGGRPGEAAAVAPTPSDGTNEAGKNPAPKWPIR